MTRGDGYSTYKLSLHVSPVVARASRVAYEQMELRFRQEIRGASGHQIGYSENRSTHGSIPSNDRHLVVPVVGVARTSQYCGPRRTAGTWNAPWARISCGKDLV